MSNTVIQLKYSATPGNIPSDLANGEIALNYADGRFYYKNTTGQIVSFVATGNLKSFSTVIANGSFITALSNTSTLTINAGNNIGITSDIINDIITISADLSAANNWANTKLANATGTFAGDLTTTGTITANSYVYITPNGGQEGGEIQLQATGGNTSWSIDSYQNNYRVFARTGSTISNVNFFHALGGTAYVRMGVNRTDPGYTLDVAGTVNASAIYVNGSPIGAGSMDYVYVNNSTGAANNYAGAMANSVNAYTSATYSTLTQFGSCLLYTSDAADE